MNTAMRPGLEKAQAEILMVAEPGKQTYAPGPFKTVWLSAAEFWSREDWVKQHDDVVWQTMQSHGKYAFKSARADWFCVAVDDQDRYVSSAFVIDGYEKWLLENVMTDPAQQGRGAASSVMARLMQEATSLGIRWVILHCHPTAQDGKLPLLYGKFGFKTVPEENI